MTKQEEIREGLAQSLFNSQMYNDQCFGADTRKKVWDKENEHYYAWADNILYDLHSEGVVLKSKRELPCPEYSPVLTMDDGYNLGFERGFKCGVMDTICEYTEAGYVAVEPLIKE